MSRDDSRHAHEFEQGWGVSPPYGAYRGHYGDPELAQTGSLSSGRLGGWSAVALGGSFAEEVPPDERLEADSDELLIDEDEDIIVTADPVEDSSTPRR